MRLKLIVSNPEGGPVGRQHIKVVNAETGEMLSGVQSVELSGDVNSLAKLVVTTVVFEADVEMVAAIRKQSLWGKLRGWWAVRQSLRAGRRYDRLVARKEGKCLRPPAGWKCTRGSGHEGPCAARPMGD